MSLNTNENHELADTLLQRLVPESVFHAVAADYLRQTGYALLLINTRGEIVMGPFPECQCDCNETNLSHFKRLVNESIRWGEPTILSCCEEGGASWACPLMCNNVLIGGLLTLGVDLDVDDIRTHSRHMRQAYWILMDIAVKAQITNESYLKEMRRKAEKDGARFESITSVKFSSHDILRQTYLSEEPFLLTAIRQNRRQEARHILNRILTVIYHSSGQRIDLLKSFSIELVSMMCRAAVEAGGAPDEILGRNYESISKLDQLDDDEDIAEWLTNMLESLMDAIRNNELHPNEILIGKAVQYMLDHITDDLDRDAVARHAGISPSHFSRLLKEKSGQTFSAMLNKIRIDKASHLLTHTQKSILDVAMECGFFDQSHFTKAFKKQIGQTPRQYKESHRLK